MRALFSGLQLLSAIQHVAIRKQRSSLVCAWQQCPFNANFRNKDWRIYFFPGQQFRESEIKKDA